MNGRKTTILIAAFATLAGLAAGPALAARDYTVVSPEKKLIVTVSIGERVLYSVAYAGRTVLAPSPVAMTLADGTVWGKAPQVRGAAPRRADEKLLPPVREKRAVVRDRYNELVLDMKGDWGLVFRAYDDGAAYRFFAKGKRDLRVAGEEAVFRFPDGASGWIAFAKSFHTSYENVYTPLPLADIGADRFGFAPVLVELPGGLRAAVTDVDVEEYPGMFLSGDGGKEPALVGKFAPFPLEERLRAKSDRELEVIRAADFIAVTKGPRSFPWRLVAVAERDADLISSDITYRLSPPLRLKDTSWIRPGKVAWDWWNDLNLYGVDFEAGVNTATYLHFVDFAAAHGIEYVILDEGWSVPADLFKVNPDIDLPRILNHAREKNVGIILWCVWLALDREMDRLLDQFAGWGVKGVKVDFMDRDDQKMGDFYWRCAEAAAKRRLLVDFHGAHKPIGIRRAYPNVITQEGVMGLESSKWSANVSPDHDLIIPFTRMFAGPMDFTPGAMINAQEKAFRFIYERPMSQGTRCHQLAMYVVYESPLQMLCDSPSNYAREPEAMAFLSKVPTVWDETLAIDGKAGDYVLLARKSGDDWYAAAMTDWTPRTLELALDFLGEGAWTAEIWSDGLNAARHAQDFARSTRLVKAGDRLKLELAPGGGWAARFVRK